MKSVIDLAELPALGFGQRPEVAQIALESGIMLRIGLPLIQQLAIAFEIGGVRCGGRSLFAGRGRQAKDQYRQQQQARTRDGHVRLPQEFDVSSPNRSGASSARQKSRSSM